MSPRRSGGPFGPLACLLPLALGLAGCGEGGDPRASDPVPGPPPQPAASSAANGWEPLAWEEISVDVRSPGCAAEDPGCARVALAWPRFTPPLDGGAPLVPALERAEAWIEARMRERGLLQGEDDVHPDPEALARAFVADHDAFRAEYPGSVSVGWELERGVEVRHAASPALVLEVHEFAWTGGAHPNSWRRGWAVTIPGGEVVDLAFLFAPEAEAAVVDLLAEAFRRDRGMAPDAPLSSGGLFEDDLPLLDNLLPDAAGLVVLYSPYAIAPYAMGEIRIRLPWEALVPFLRPEARRALAPWLPS